MANIQWQKVGYIKGWALILIIAQVVFLWAYVVNNAHFVTDDVHNFVFALRQSVLNFDYLTTPIDVHVVPIYRLVNYLLVHYFPVNNNVTVGLLMSCHIVTMVYLYRLLQHLNPGSFNVLLLIIYASSIYLIYPLMWWSAGLHRFPYIMCSVLTMYYFVDYRVASSKTALVKSAVWFLVAFGFYAKAVLIPFYLLLLEIYLFTGIRTVGRYRSLLKVAPFFAVSAVYVLFYLVSANNEHAGFGSKLSVMFGTFKIAANIAAQSLLPLAYSRELNEWFIFGWLLLLAASILLVRKNFYIGVMGLGLIALNLLMLAISSRSSAFPYFIAFEPRYYFELCFLFILMLGLLYRQPSLACFENRRYFRRWMALPLLLFTVICYQLLAAQTVVVGFSHERYDRYRNANSYVFELKRSMREIVRDSSGWDAVSIANGEIPKFISSGIIHKPVLLSEYLPILGISVEFVDPGVATHRVTTSGAIEYID